MSMPSRGYGGVLCVGLVDLEVSLGGEMGVDVPAPCARIGTKRQANVSALHKASLAATPKPFVRLVAAARMDFSGNIFTVGIGVSRDDMTIA